MDKTDTVVHINENADSIEIGTPGKGGAIKVYFNSDKIDEAKVKIDNAAEVRAYAQTKLNIGG